MTRQLAVYREFGSLKAPQVRYLQPGQTLAEMRAAMTCLPHDFDSRGVICINGRRVQRGAWHLITPKAVANGVTVEVTFHAPPMGGGGKEGGGKNILAIVAGIALTAVTGFVAGGGLAAKLGFSAKLFGAGTIGATLAAAGLSLLGSLLISSLVPPPTVSTGKTINNAGAASAEGNVLEPNGPIPRVLGSRKVFPPLACEPFTYFEGPDELVEAIYVLSGPHEMTDIRVGAAAIEVLTNVDFETRVGYPGELPILLVERQARTEGLQTELRGYTVDASDGFTLESPTGDFAASLPQAITVATRDAPDEQWLHLIFPGGINLNAGSAVQRVPLRLRIREVGSPTWIDLPELHFAAATQRQLRATIKLVWTDDASASPGAAVTEGWIEARISAPAQTAAPATPAWAADAYFDDGAGDVWVNSSNLGSTRVQHLLMDRYTATILLDTASFPKGRYEVEIKRGQHVPNSAWSSSAYTVSGTVWDLFAYANVASPRISTSRNGVADSVVLLRSVSIWNEHPMPGDGLAVIAVRARNRALDKVSCFAGGLVRDWDGTGWRNWVVTSNPAAHMYDILAGRENLDPVPLSVIDSAGLVDWRTACTALGYEVNALIEDGTVDDAARIVASCGYAKPYQSEIWGVVRDKDRSAEAPVQVFTPRNSSGFQWAKAFPRLPEGFRVNFRDATRDYDSHQITVFRPGVSSDTGRLEQVTYEGLVTEAEVRARALYDLAQLDRRGVFYTLKAPAEAIICRRGDLVGVQHDALEVHGGQGRVIDITFNGSGDITALKLDSTVPLRNNTDLLASADILAEPDILALGAKTGALIRRDASNTVHELTGTTGDTDVLTFAAAISPTGIGIGTLVATGPLAREVKRLLVFAIEPEEDLTATITMVDEAPGVVPDLS